MKILILGATGGTGQRLLSQALQQGHTITALARNPAALEARHERLEVVQGSVLDIESVEQAVAGQDAVLSALGVTGVGSLYKPVTLYSAGGRCILQAMEKHGVRRLVCVTSGGVEDDDPSFGLMYKLIFKPLLLQRAYADMQRLEALVRASALEWVIVRPSRLTDGPLTGAYRVSPRYAPPGGVEISRADLAHFMLQQLTDARYLHQTPTLAY